MPYICRKDYLKKVKKIDKRRGKMKKKKSLNPRPSFYLYSHKGWQVVRGEK
jgi:hypothetical protein